MSEYKSKWIKDGYVIETSEVVDLWYIQYAMELYLRNGLAESELGVSPSENHLIKYRIRPVDSRTDYNGYNEENASKGNLMETKAFTAEEMLEFAAYFKRRGFYAGIAFSAGVIVANKTRKKFKISVVRKNTKNN